MRAVAIAALLSLAEAQDPAQGWLAYATAKPPAGATRITLFEARWKVGSNPRSSQSFYSPWFGMDPSDNLNLLQPVNPWLGDSWLAYCEYYQWSPSHNENSAQHTVNAGDILHGSITYRASDDTYLVEQHDETDGWSVTMPIKSQHGKNFTIPYVVYEKVAPCGDYPPDESVVFYDINIVYDNVPGQALAWTTGIVDNVCEFQAHINDPSTTNGNISITWSNTAADPPAHLIARDQKKRTGWAAAL